MLVPAQQCVLFPCGECIPPDMVIARLKSVEVLSDNSDTHTTRICSRLPNIQLRDAHVGKTSRFAATNLEVLLNGVFH